MVSDQDDLRANAFPANSETEARLLRLLATAIAGAPVAPAIPEAVAAIRFGLAGKFLRLSVLDADGGMTTEVTQALEPLCLTESDRSANDPTLMGSERTGRRFGGLFGIGRPPRRGRWLAPLSPHPETAETNPNPDRSALTRSEAVWSEVVPGNGELILLVESDPHLRDRLVNRLEVIGFALIDAPDGAAAMALLDAGEPVDLVICDADADGECSGLQLVRRIRDLYPGIGLLLTATEPGVTLLQLAEAPLLEVEVLASSVGPGPLSAAIHRALLRRNGG